MADIFAELHKLAAIDGKLVRLKKVLDSLPGELAAQKDKMAAVKAERDAAANAIKELATKVDGMNLEVKANEQEIRDNDQKIGAIKNTKEYQIITGRIKELKQKVGEFESRELEMMESLDNLKEEMKQKNEEYEQEQLALEEKEKELSEGVIEIKKEQQQLAAQRSEQIAVVRGINEDVLAIYSNALKRGKGKALAELKDGVCQGCFRRVEPNIISAVNYATKLDECRCAGCGRIMYLANKE